MSTLPTEPRALNYKANQLLLFAILVGVVLYFGRSLLVPFTAAAFLAMLMAPVSNMLEKFMKRTFALIVCILILLVGILAIMAVIVAEIKSVMGDLPQIVATAKDLVQSMEATLRDTFGIAPQKHITMAKEQITTFGQFTGSYLDNIVGGTMSVLGTLVIILLYTFLMLLHRDRYETFFILLFKVSDKKHTKVIIGNIASVGQNYIKGKTVSILVVWLFYAVCLTAIGLKNGILLGAIASLLFIVPFVGGVIGGLFPFFMSLTEPGSSAHPWEVVIVVVLANALSTYVVEPLIIGGRLRLSALSMMFFIIAGGALWGIAGMILFIPILAMIKILCDNIDSLQSVSYLISDADEGKTSAVGRWFSGIWQRVFSARKFSQ